MNFLKSKIVFFSLALSLCLSSNVVNAQVSSVAEEKTQVASIKEAENVANSHILSSLNDENCRWNQGVKIDEKEVLFGLNGIPSAYLFELKGEIDSDCGYVLVNASKSQFPILEFSFEGDPFFDTAIEKIETENNKKGRKIKKDKKKLYYIGGFEYFIEQEFEDNSKVIYDISTSDLKEVNLNEIEDRNELNTDSKEYEKLWSLMSEEKCISYGSNQMIDAPQNQSSFIIDPTLPSYEQYTSNYLKNHPQVVSFSGPFFTSRDVLGYNLNYFTMRQFRTGGVCYPTAATNLLYYWSNRDYNRFDKMSINGWKGTFDVLYDMMGSTTTTTLDSKVAVPIIALCYFKGEKVNATFNENVGSTSVMNQINLDRPFILMLHGHHTYKDHGVLALGYVNYRYSVKFNFMGTMDVNSTYIRVADGWINTPTRYVWLNTNGIKNAVYFNPNGRSSLFPFK